MQTMPVDEPQKKARRPKRRVFYVIYLPERSIESHINAIKLLCEPNAKTVAHLTVRGPYLKQVSVDEISSAVSGTNIQVTGVDCFFEPNQNTVFLRCDGDSLRSVWRKSDFGYNPHITLYDGGSRRFAEQLLDVLGNYNLSFSFKAPGLEPLVSVSGQTDASLVYSVDSAWLGEVVGRQVDPGRISSLTEETRLAGIARLVASLAAVLRER